MTRKPRERTAVRAAPTARDAAAVSPRRIDARAMASRAIAGIRTEPSSLPTATASFDNASAVSSAPMFAQASAPTTSASDSAYRSPASAARGRHSAITRAASENRPAE